MLFFLSGAKDGIVASQKKREKTGRNRHSRQITDDDIEVRASQVAQW